MTDTAPRIVFDLSLEEAQALHAALEEMLESHQGSDALKRIYRVVGWRTLAAQGGTGLTARLSEIARQADTLEEFEAARDQHLGPILDGLERGENRDP
ncbi:hypothetical protein BH23ACT11_BH23ACT11_07550 [soil metagenome]